MCSTSQIILRIESILEYLQPHWEWLNCHMVSYLTDKHWVRYVPLQMRQNIETVDQIEKCIQQVFWNNSGSIDFPDIHHHLVQSRQYCLQNFPELLTSSQKLKDILNIKATQDRLSIKEFMSEKKRHEVEITAELVNDLIDSHNGQELFIVDAGDGKGYLSSRLALQYGHKILGIDCKESNTENALERSKKLEVP